MDVRDLKHVKLYGLPRSCSNLVQHLIKLNFGEAVRCWSNEVPGKDGTAVSTNAFGTYKHGVLMDPESLGFVDFHILNVKNPFAWMVSWRKHAYRHYTPYNQVPMPPMEVWLGQPSYLGNSNQIIWSAANRFWLTTLPNLIVVRQEDLVDEKSTKAEIKRWASEMGLDAPADPLCEHKAVHPGARTKQNEFDKAPYQEHRYMRDFTDQDVHRVCKHLDRKVVEQLGYTELLTKITNGVY